MGRDDEDDRCCDAELRVRFFAAVATVFILLCLLCQDWGSQFNGLRHGSSSPGWGVYVTRYVIFLEAMAFALAPVPAENGDSVVIALQVGYGLIAFSSLAVALATHVFPPMNDGGVGDILILVHILTLGLGGISVCFCATLGAKEAGYFKQMPDLPLLGQIFAGITVIYLVIILLLVFGKVPVTILTFLLVKQASVAVWTGILAFATDNRLIGVWILASFAACWLIMHFKPSPFSASTTFNHEALCHCIEMYYMGGTFSLCNELIEQGATMLAKMSHAMDQFQSRLEEGMGGHKPLRNDRCCDDCVGRK